MVLECFFDGFRAVLWRFYGGFRVVLGIVCKKIINAFKVFLCVVFRRIIGEVYCHFCGFIIFAFEYL